MRSMSAQVHGTSPMRSNGKADFTPSAQDLLSTNPFGKAGLYKVYPVVTLSTGPVAMDAQIVQVVALP
jgi:hypothetical protein